MDRFQILEWLGDGTYGTVTKAKNKETGDVVALKQLKRPFHSWKECISLREIESLRSISNHPQIVELREVIRESNSRVFFAFEYMPDGNLYEFMKNRAREVHSNANKATRNVQHGLIEMNQFKNILSQILTGLAHIHSHGYFHRDIKPENILLWGNQCKIADFGLARAIGSRRPYTEYVSTRWYRAPEVLLRSPEYGPPIDIFAVGCVAAELATLRPLFPGSSEVDQVRKIVDVLGEPSPQDWPEGLQLAAKMGIMFDGTAQFRLDGQIKLKAILQLSSPETVFLIWSMLRLDPKLRPSAGESLRYSFFGGKLHKTEPQLKSGPRIEQSDCAQFDAGQDGQELDRLAKNLNCFQHGNSLGPISRCVAGVKRPRMDEIVKDVPSSKAFLQSSHRKDLAFNMWAQNQQLHQEIRNELAFGAPVPDVNGMWCQRPQYFPDKARLNPLSVLGKIEADNDSGTPRLMSEQSLTPGVSPPEVQNGRNMINSASRFSNFKCTAKTGISLCFHSGRSPTPKKSRNKERGLAQHNGFSHLPFRGQAMTLGNPENQNSFASGVSYQQPTNLPLNSQQGRPNMVDIMSTFSNGATHMNTGVGGTCVRSIV